MSKIIGIDLGTTNSCVAVMAVSYTHLTSAEPVDITADALPGDWAGGHYTVSDASRAAVQSFFNLSPAAALPSPSWNRISSSRAVPALSLIHICW